MTINLDDVYNLLHIPIQGRMLDHDEVMDWNRAIDLMTRLLGMSDATARDEVMIESAGHISYPTLRRLYEAHLTEAAGGPTHEGGCAGERQEEAVVCEEFSSISCRLCVVH